MLRIRSLPRAALLVVPMWLAATASPAWDDIGHEMVARVAWRRLCEPERREALRLLRAAPEDAQLASLEPKDLPLPPSVRERIFFERASVWADQVRQDPTYHQGAWHYVNWFWRERADGTIENLPWPLREPNVLTAVRTQATLLADPDVPTPERGLALAWLLHLVGDVHQPLHTSGRVTAREPRGDRGGNDYALAGVPGDDAHGLWDGILRWRMPRADGEPMGAWMSRLADRVDGAAEVEVSCPREPVVSAWNAEAVGASVELWALESLWLAQTEVYSIERGSAPNEAQLEQLERVAVRRMVQAGERLAQLIAGHLVGQ